MQILDQTRGTTVASRVRVADNFLARGRGLIGMPPLQAGEGLVIKPCKGVHMWFMKYPIDVVYVDREDRVVDVDENMQPWRLGRPRPRARYVIELPAGAAGAAGVQVGDQLVLLGSPPVASH